MHDHIPLEMTEKRRVVITGLGVVAPNGIGKAEFWRNCATPIVKPDLI